MSDDSKQFFRFGRFSLRLVDHVLLRDSAQTNLSPRASEILAYLIQNRDHLVSKDELKLHLWPDVHISGNSIDQKISEIRRILGDNSGEPSYIETKYKRGWRFIGNCTEGTEALAYPSGPGAPSIVNRKRLARTLIAAGVAAFGGVAFTLLFAFTPEARVVRYTQLTNDGRRKDGPLFTNGHRIFFTETFGTSDKLMSIPTGGGEAIALNVPLSNFDLQDISPDGSTLLLRSFGSAGD